MPALAAASDVLLDPASPGVIVGGVALNLLGRPRPTENVDAVVLHDGSLESLVRAFRVAGLEGRIRDLIPFARRARSLLLRHRATGVEVDVSLGILVFEIDAVENRAVRNVGDALLPVPAIEDLVVLKAIANRPKDLDDVRALLAAHPDLDPRRALRKVREFARFIGAPQIYAEFERACRRAV